MTTNAKQTLIDTVNAVIRKRNHARMLRRLPLAPTYTMRHIERVVCVARAMGDLGPQIEAAGWRAVK